MKIILYSTNCPKCKVLTMKLDVKHIPYKINTDVDYMISKGMLSAPYLEVDGVMMGFTDAIKWVNEQN